MTGIILEISPVAAGVAVAVALMAGSVLALRQRGTLTPRRLLVAWLTSWYLAGVAAVTLPLQIRTGDYSNLVPWYQKANFVPLIGLDTRTVVLNIVMTFPLGLLLPFLTRVSSVRQVALTGLALSAAIEVTQFLSDVLVSGGRTADVNDLPVNTIGAVFGYLTYRSLSSLPAVAGRWGTPSRPQRPIAADPRARTSILAAPTGRGARAAAGPGVAYRGVRGTEERHDGPRDTPPRTASRKVIGVVPARWWK